MRRPRFTYANVASSLALFVALGGVSWAAATLPKNSVGSTQIKSSAVTGAKVKNSSLTGADIKNASLTAADFSGSVQGAKGDTGAKGDPGPQGAAGPQGVKGDPGDPKRSFARVAYTGGVPAITAQSGSLSIVNEPFAGAVRIGFPASMEACAITATSVSGGTNASLRRSTLGSGSEVVVVTFDTAGTVIEADFDLIAQC